MYVLNIEFDLHRSERHRGHVTFGAVDRVVQFDKDLFSWTGMISSTVK